MHFFPENSKKNTHCNCTFRVLFVEGSLEKDETRNSHMFFTVHIYQVEKRSKNSKGRINCIQLVLWHHTSIFVALVPCRLRRPFSGWASALKNIAGARIDGLSKLWKCWALMGATLQVSCDLIFNFLLQYLCISVCCYPFQSMVVGLVYTLSTSPAVRGTQGPRKTAVLAACH